MRNRVPDLEATCQYIEIPAPVAQPREWSATLQKRIGATHDVLHLRPARVAPVGTAGQQSSMSARRDVDRRSDVLNGGSAKKTAYEKFLHEDLEIGDCVQEGRFVDVVDVRTAQTAGGESVGSAVPHALEAMNVPLEALSKNSRRFNGH
ncbi:MAG TPA: hypothetical protein VF057_04390 [Thermoanaerobaculia bacterium]